MNSLKNIGSMVRSESGKQVLAYIGLCVLFAIVHDAMEHGYGLDMSAEDGRFHVSFVAPLAAA